LASIYKALNSFADQYDIILANYSLTAFPVSFCKSSNSKKYYYIQAYEPDYFESQRTLKSKILGLLSKLSYYLPLNRIVNAPLYFKYKNIRSDKFVFPGLDLNIFKPDEKTVIDFKKKDKIIIGCIGRKEPEKGIKYVLAAFKRLYCQDKRFLLRVAYGNLPSDWSHERCEVVIPNNDLGLASFYKSLDILIAPGTVQHGAPHYPVLEAMACGIPVVTTGYYGADNSTAWIIESRSSESIVKAVTALVNDMELAYSKSLKAMQLAKQLDWEIVSKKMIDYFTQSPRS
jgi:glycosyltransferase involved in cell wall biosynthesis